MPGLEFTIIKKETLDSTQEYLAKILQEEKLNEGSLVITQNQTTGKGQEGNTWASENGKNITLSLLLRPGFLHPSHQFMLTKMISLAVLHCLNQVPGMQNTLSVKWPNDIYAGDCKIGGILISNAIMGNTIEHTIIGIGLNINQVVFPPFCPNPTSIKLETGKEQDLEKILNMLLSSVNEYYSALQQIPAFLDMRYLEVLYRVHEWKHYEILSQKTEAMIRGVNEYGILQLETKDKRHIECDLKEIKYL